MDEVGPIPDISHIRNRGKLITEADGAQYYCLGKIRIKITEHFPAKGKPIEELMADLVIHKIKEKVSKLP